MVDVSFLCNYKGILYPLDLDKQIQSFMDPSPLARNGGKDGLKSLVDLSSEKIVMDSTSTARALEVVPSELCYSLMRAALVRTRDRSIEVLIAKWPWSVLRLQRLAPCLFDSISALYNDVTVADQMRKGVKYTTCLAHTFVECLKKRAPTKLKYLDLTGFPAAEVIVNYLSSHVLLVYNEARQKEIISMYNKVTHDWPEEQRHNYNLDTTLPDDMFLICVDAFLQTSDTHMELCRALKMSRLDACRFRLRVQKLDLTCLGVARISVLLEQVDPRHLTALCLQFNSLDNQGLVILGPQIQRFNKLTALDLSCNNIKITTNDTAPELLAETLGALPDLVRLDLSNNSIKHKLRLVLHRIQRPLNYLRICACCLSELDLQYLGMSHHVQGLRELDISENNLGRHFIHVPPLLEALRSRLIILEVESCQFQNKDLHEFLTLSPRLQKLRYLNICYNNEFLTDFMLAELPQLAKIKSLEVIKLSCPLDSYNDEVEMRLFQQQLCTLMISVCDQLQRPYIKISFTA